MSPFCIFRSNLCGILILAFILLLKQGETSESWGSLMLHYSSSYLVSLKKETPFSLFLVIFLRLTVEAFSLLHCDCLLMLTLINMIIA